MLKGFVFIACAASAAAFAPLRAPLAPGTALRPRDVAVGAVSKLSEAEKSQLLLQRQAATLRWHPHPHRQLQQSNPCTARLLANASLERHPRRFETAFTGPPARVEPPSSPSPLFLFSCTAPLHTLG